MAKRLNYGPYFRPAGGTKGVKFHLTKTRGLAVKQAGGFSLIELMITVAIIGILAAIAYPSYTNYLVKGTRANAKSVLLDIAQKEQAYLLDNRSYVGAGTCAEVQSNLKLASNAMLEVDKYYECDITLGTGPQPQFTATLAPKAGLRMASDGDQWIKETGEKSF